MASLAAGFHFTRRTWVAGGAVAALALVLMLLTVFLLGWSEQTDGPDGGVAALQGSSGY